ncbi:PSP domain-containing protein [Giardia muris]|uniref:PSP domain-containing protein n=1 Tax=Giardia muris TaxID=5742 RepID=A0A4Z1T426_GIAMU|nr:PSP domain-containing protein [Giardia muris]|eukprot:TNJ27161.1 PSP domain-containing protein [Giardia muris]
MGRRDHATRNKARKVRAQARAEGASNASNAMVPVSSVTPISFPFNPSELKKQPSEFAQQSLTSTITRRQEKEERRALLGAYKCVYGHRRIENIDADDLTGIDYRLNVALLTASAAVGIPVHWPRRQGVFLSEKLPKYIAVASQSVGYRIPAFVHGVYDSRARSRASSQPNRNRLKATRHENKALDILDRYGWIETPLLECGMLYYEGMPSLTCRTFLGVNVLSPTLRTALGIGPTDPPPWIHIQRSLPMPSWLQDISMTPMTQQRAPEVSLVSFLEY